MERGADLRGPAAVPGAVVAESAELHVSRVGDDAVEVADRGAEERRARCSAEQQHRAVDARVLLEATVAIDDGAEVVADARDEAAERGWRSPLPGLDREDDTAQDAGDDSRGSRDERRCGPRDDERIDECSPGLSPLDLDVESADTVRSMPSR